MCQAKEQVGPSLWHLGKPEGGRSCLLDRPRVLSRRPLEPGEMVPAWVSQELGSQGSGEDYCVRSRPSRFERPRSWLFEEYSVPWGEIFMSRQMGEINLPIFTQLVSTKLVYVEGSL